jgi:hypothetical protein
VSSFALRGQLLAVGHPTDLTHPRALVACEWDAVAACESVPLGAPVVVVLEAEHVRLREAAAYASFARPLLEKLGDKNPLAEI